MKQIHSEATYAEKINKTINKINKAINKDRLSKNIVTTGRLTKEEWINLSKEYSLSILIRIFTFVELFLSSNVRCRRAVVYSMKLNTLS